MIGAGAGAVLVIGLGCKATFDHIKKHLDSKKHERYFKLFRMYQRLIKTAQIPSDKIESWKESRYFTRDGQTNMEQMEEVIDLFD